MILANFPIWQKISEEYFKVLCSHLLKSVDIRGQAQYLDDAVIVPASPMSYISHSAISRGINQSTNFAMVTNSPRTFDQSEEQGFDVNKFRIGGECPELLRVSEDVSVSVMEDNARVEKLGEGLIEVLRDQAQILQGPSRR